MGSSEKAKAVANLLSVLAGTGVTLGVWGSETAQKIIEAGNSKYVVLGLLGLQLVSAFAPQVMAAFNSRKKSPA